MGAVSLVGAAMAVLVLVLGVLLQRRESTIQDRLARYAQRNATLEDMELRLPLTERIIVPIVQRVSSFLYRLTPGSQIAETRHNLAMAGNPRGLTVASFQVYRLAAGLLLGGGFAFYGGLINLPTTASLGVGMPLAALGFMLPSIWLGGRVRKRQEAVQRALPDAIDLLTVCVEAGAGFDAALAKVVTKWSGPLTGEFERLLADLRMGRTRRDALRDLADRTGVLDVQSFVSALIQADQLGVGLIKVLRIQADQMRQRRRIRAEEQAQRAPVKMLFPLIFLIFPSVYIIILGPAALSLMKTFSGGG